METATGLFLIQMQKAAIHRIDSVVGLREYLIFFKQMIEAGKMHEVVAEYAAFPHLMSEDEIKIVHSDDLEMKELISLGWLTSAKYTHVNSVFSHWLHERPKLWSQMYQHVLQETAKH